MQRLLQYDGHQVAMRANAATPYRYRQVWGEDLLVLLSDTEKRSDGEIVETLLRLGYVMALQAGAAEHEEMTNIFAKAQETGEAGFIQWMDREDIPREAWEGILAIYTGQQQAQSVKKKEIGPSTGR